MSERAKIMTFSHLPGLMLPTVHPNEKAEWIVWEVSTILGYIPGVGTIVGIARAIFAAVKWQNQTDNSNELRKPFMIRALIEGLSLGIFLLPIDIFNSVVHRNKSFFTDFEATPLVGK